MNYPTSWDRYDKAVHHVDLEVYGFAVSVGDINRWAARFSAAKSFQGVILNGYSAATESGYSAMCRVVFTWSAFELFLPMIGHRQESCATLFMSPESRTIANKVSKLDSDERFYGFVHSHANSKHQKELARWHNGEPYNITYLVSAIRHIFAHGHLTPNVNEIDPERCSQVCSLLCDHLIEVMDTEFSSRVERLYE